MRHSAAKHLAATVLILALGGAAKADINITQWDLRQHVREGTGLGEDWILHSEVTLPVFEFEHTATHLGSTSTGTYTFDVDATGNAATFAFTMEQTRGAPSLQLRLEFRFHLVRLDRGCLLQSRRSLCLDGTSGHYSARALMDLAGGTVFRNRQGTVTGTSPPGEDLILGELGGAPAINPILIGDLSGMLLAGHSYRLEYHYVLTENNFDRTSGSSTSGVLNFGLSPIPAPGAALLGIIGLAGAHAVRRRIA